MNDDFEPILKLSRAERLQLVEYLWDSIVREEEVTPVSNEKRNELRRRKEEFERNPESGVSWEHVKAFARAPRNG